MPKIQIDHACSLQAPDAFQKIKTFFDSEDIRRIDSKIKCQFNEAEMSGKANGSQFKADVAVKPASGGSSVSIVVDLPLMLTPFKSKVEETIQRKLKKHLG